MALKIPSLSGDSSLILQPRPGSDMVFAVFNEDWVCGNEALARTCHNSLFSRIRGDHTHMQRILMRMYKSEGYELPEQPYAIGMEQKVEAISFTTDSPGIYAAVFKSDDDQIGMSTYAEGWGPDSGEIAIAWLPRFKGDDLRQILYEECKNHILPQWSESYSYGTCAATVTLPFSEIKKSDNLFNTFRVI